MHCTTLYSFAAAAFLAITAQAAPAGPTAVFPRQVPSGVFERQIAETGLVRRQASQIVERQIAAPTGVFPNGVFPRQASGIFQRQVPAPTAAGFNSFQRRDPADPPYVSRNAEPEAQSTASCSSTDDKAPQYTITIPSDIVDMDSFSTQNLISAIQAAGDPVFGFGSKTNGDGGITMTFSSSGEIASNIDLALAAVSEGNFPDDAMCSTS